MEWAPAALAAVAAVGVAASVLPTPSLLLVAAFLLRTVLVRPTVHEPKPVPKLVDAADTSLTDAERRQRGKVCVVTGASGFTGQVVVDYLLQDGRYDEIRAVDVVPPKFADRRVVNSAADITDEAAMSTLVRGAGVVFHLASLVDLRDNVYRRHRIYDVNVRGTAVLLNACIREGVGRFVYLGSATAVFDNKPRPTRDEAAFADVTVDSLRTHYAKSKRLAEMLVREANGRGGLRTVTLRPFSIFGANDRMMSAAMLRDPQIFFADDGTTAGAQIYVKNLAHWLSLAAQALDTKPSEVSGQAFFVSNALNEQAITYNNYRTGLYRRRRGPAPQIISLTNYPWAIRAFAFTLLEAVDWLTGGRLNHDVFQLNWNTISIISLDGTVDATRGARLLGYAPKYTFDQSLDDLAKEVFARIT